MTTLTINPTAKREFPSVDLDLQRIEITVHGLVEGQHYERTSIWHTPKTLHVGDIFTLNYELTWEGKK